MAGGTRSVIQISDDSEDADSDCQIIDEKARGSATASTYVSPLYLGSAPLPRPATYFEDGRAGWRSATSTGPWQEPRRRPPMEGTRLREAGLPGRKQTDLSACNPSLLMSSSPTPYCTGLSVQSGEDVLNLSYIIKSDGMTIHKHIVKTAPSKPPPSPGSETPSPDSDTSSPRRWPRRLDHSRSVSSWSSRRRRHSVSVSSRERRLRYSPRRRPSSGSSRRSLPSRTSSRRSRDSRIRRRDSRDRSPDPRDRRRDSRNRSPDPRDRRHDSLDRRRDSREWRRVSSLSLASSCSFRPRQRNHRRSSDSESSFWRRRRLSSPRRRRSSSSSFLRYRRSRRPSSSSRSRSWRSRDSHRSRDSRRRQKPPAPISPTRSCVSDDRSEPAGSVSLNTVSPKVYDRRFSAPCGNMDIEQEDDGYSVSPVNGASPSPQLTPEAARAALVKLALRSFGGDATANQPAPRPPGLPTNRPKRHHRDKREGVREVAEVGTPPRRHLLRSAFVVGLMDWDPEVFKQGIQLDMFEIRVLGGLEELLPNLQKSLPAGRVEEAALCQL
eukprot:Gregarina_sp_Pseudo_9__292@NODE_1189_length_1799_cov_11_798864_g1115_i0_p1_GENE_NODE_1189_length_1799_cov_11_798864_g1115_i0NODE_1189_length_1799_cov_11_798864_g1115_i0_p1_ORF_typecomplete_len552_score80_90_NODE_1189_length_1799_cov_11_798864_g1115_i0561711